MSTKIVKSSSTKEANRERLRSSPPQTKSSAASTNYLDVKRVHSQKTKNKQQEQEKKIPQSKRSSIPSKTPRTAHQKQSNTRHTKIFHHKIESNKMKDKDKKAC